MRLKILFKIISMYLSVIIAIGLMGLSSFNLINAENTNKSTQRIYINATAVIETNWGTFKAMLYEEGAPITTKNFIKLANEGFYNGTKFHRVIDDFVIQGGDPNSKDNNPYNDGTGGSNETIPLEINETLTHIDGALGMARSSDPDSASSQFYVCDGAQHGLDGDYAVFGVVVEGMDVVRKIASCETYGYKRPLLKDHPVDDIVMNIYIIPGHFENVTNNGTSKISKSSSSIPGFDYMQVYGAFMTSTLLFAVWGRKRVLT